MPITSIGSYISTAGNIIAHYTDVNADRLANALPELLLTGGYSLASFTADRDTLQTSIDDVIGLENANVLASGDRDAQKENLLDRLRQFRAALKLHFKGTTYEDAAPRVPTASIAQSKFMRPLTDMSDLWVRLDASGGVGGFTPPLLLRGGYTQAGLDADMATLRTAYQLVDDAENDIEMRRKQRDALLDPFRERMLQYRAAIQLEYDEGHPFTQSLPDVSPSPGSTPDAVTLSGAWDAAMLFAVLNWTALNDPDLQDYQPWYTQGATFDQNTAISITSQGPNVTQLNTVEGLSLPGDVATYRIYAVLSTGEQIASNDLTITRP
jgi:hypothetical protein